MGHKLRRGGGDSSLTGIIGPRDGIAGLRNRNIPSEYNTVAPSTIPRRGRYTAMACVRCRRRKTKACISGPQNDVFTDVSRSVYPYQVAKDRHVNDALIQAISVYSSPLLSAEA